MEFLLQVGKLYYNGGIIENNITETEIGNETYPIIVTVKLNTENDTSEIQIALDKAKEELVNNTDNVIEVYIPAGTYYINKVLNIYSNTRLLLDDNATLIHSTGKTAMLKASHLDENCNICSGLGCNHEKYTQWKNITVEGGIWDCNNDGSSNLNGLVFAHGENLIIRNTTLINNAGHTLNPSCSKDILIENVTIKSQISSEPKKPNDTNEVIHLDSASTGEPSSYPIDGTPVKNVIIQNCILEDVFCGIGSHSSYTNEGYMGDSIVIRNNTFKNIQCYAINLYAHKNVEIYNNVAVGKNVKNIISNNNEAYGFVQTFYANVNIHDNIVDNFEYTLVNGEKNSNYEIICDDDSKVNKFYIVTYDANGAEGIMAPQIFEYNINNKLTQNEFKREGYIFGGWNAYRNYPSSQRYKCEQVYDNTTWHTQETIDEKNFTKYIYSDGSFLKTESWWHHSELKMIAKWIKRINIKISTKPNKLIYIQGSEELDLDGGIITSTYEDESIDEISLNEDEVKVTGFDNTIVGKNTITVEYEGLTTTFDVEIIEDTIKPILEIGTISKEWTNKNIGVTINAKDNETGIKSVFVNDKEITGENGIYEYIVTQNGTYKVVAIDNSDNITTKVFIISNIDKTYPEIYGLSKQSVYIRPINLLIKDIDSGIASIIISKDGKKTIYDKTYIELNQDGIYEIEVTDNVGNVIKTKFRIAYQEYMLLQRQNISEEILDNNHQEDNEKVKDDDKNQKDSEEDILKENDDKELIEKPEYGYKVIDGYVYVNTPGISIQEFTSKLVDFKEYNVTVKGGKVKDKLCTGSVVAIDTKDGQNLEILEIVVKGDINGDGEIDALDSAQIRNVISDSITLVGVYKAAADVNEDGDIDTLDSLLILKYRADIIEVFEDII